MELAASVLAALGAAAGFSLAAVLQQESATSIPSRRSLRVRLLIDLLARPKWIGGLAFMLAGFGLQALALAYGPVALVQPIIVVELALAIPLGIWRRQRRAGAREWAGIACVIAGITVFLSVALPEAGRADPPGDEWLVTLVPIGALIAGALAVATRLTGPARALVLGGAAGIAFGVLAVLTKTVVHLLGLGVGSAFASWQLYLLIVVGIGAFVISQSAYQAGPLAYSMPLSDVLEPLVAVVLGDTLLDERVRLSPGLLALQLVAAAVASCGILLLATSPVVLAIHEEH